MPKNIVDAYRQAVSKNKNMAFDEVVKFCEQDDTCRNDNSLTKNVMMFWSYKKIALFYEKSKNFGKAYVFWQRAYDFASKPKTKIQICHHMLYLINKMRNPMAEKAQEIVRVTKTLQNVYAEIGNSNGILRVSKLQDAARKLLKKSKYLH